VCEPARADNTNVLQLLSIVTLVRGFSWRIHILFTPFLGDVLCIIKAEALHIRHCFNQCVGLFCPNVFVSSAMCCVVTCYVLTASLF